MLLVCTFNWLPLTSPVNFQHLLQHHQDVTLGSKQEASVIFYRNKVHIRNNSQQNNYSPSSQTDIKPHKSMPILVPRQFTIPNNSISHHRECRHRPIQCCPVPRPVKQVEPQAPLCAPHNHAGYQTISYPAYHRSPEPHSKSCSGWTAPCRSD